jgi:hypothetical protein
MCRLPAMRHRAESRIRAMLHSSESGIELSLNERGRGGGAHYKCWQNLPIGEHSRRPCPSVKFSLRLKHHFAGDAVSAGFIWVTEQRTRLERGVSLSTCSSMGVLWTSWVCQQLMSPPPLLPATLGEGAHALLSIGKVPSLLSTYKHLRGGGVQWELYGGTIDIDNNCR